MRYTLIIDTRDGGPLQAALDGLGLKLASHTEGDHLLARNALQRVHRSAVSALVLGGGDLREALADLQACVDEENAP